VGAGLHRIAAIRGVAVAKIVMQKVIQFSGGRTSAYMTQRLIAEQPGEYLVLFQNTGKEMPSTLDFIHECDQRWGLGIAWLEYRYGNNFEVVDYATASRDGRPFAELIAHKKHFLPNRMTRYCTDQLKIQTARRYLQSIGITEWEVFIGIRYDEPRRWSKTANHPQYMEVAHPLVKWKVTKADVLKFWAAQDFDLRLNEPYGNCDCCFLKGKGKLATIARERPDLFKWWEDHEANRAGGYDRMAGAFKEGTTYRAIRELAEISPGLFDDDPTFECFCNTD
jgi:3'-phosphoadenosine 5'-phosphosulfate sulfotransferase (PAPS reductase)/FAD synthetase